MKVKIYLSSLLFFAISFTIHSQTIYHLKYKSPDTRDTVIYDAFFSLSDNGTGTVRVSYQSPDSNQVTAEMEIQEQYAKDKNGVLDTTKLVYEGKNPKIVLGDSKIKFTPVTFWFTVNAENFYDPWAVTLTSGSPLPPPENNFLSVEFIKSEDLPKNKDLVSIFFADTSAYYVNLFRPKARGGMLTPDERRNTRMFLKVVASTNDSILLPNCLIDAQKVVGAFSDIADFMGIRKFIDTVYGDTYNKASVQAMLQNLKPTKNDIVIFYYSGHGFTDRKFKNKDFPFLDLRDPTKRPRPDARTQTLNIEDIYNTIIKKGARFNLVLSDCCNDTIEAKKITGTQPAGHKGLTKKNFDNLRALFMSKDQINLLMTAASKDERATVTPHFSSYFTYFFLASLSTYLSPEKGYPNWYQVLADAQKQTTFQASTVPCPDGKMCQQTPKLLLPK